MWSSRLPPSGSAGSTARPWRLVRHRGSGAARTVDELPGRLPDFCRAYEPDGLTPAEFNTFGATARTLRAFIASYHDLLRDERMRPCPTRICGGAQRSPRPSCPSIRPHSPNDAAPDRLRLRPEPRRQRLGRPGACRLALPLVPRGAPRRRVGGMRVGRPGPRVGRRQSYLGSDTWVLSVDDGPVPRCSPGEGPCSTGLPWLASTCPRADRPATVAIRYGPSTGRRSTLAGDRGEPPAGPASRRNLRPLVVRSGVHPSSRGPWLGARPHGISATSSHPSSRRTGCCSSRWSPPAGNWSSWPPHSTRPGRDAGRGGPRGDLPLPVPPARGLGKSSASIERPDTRCPATRCAVGRPRRRGRHRSPDGYHPFSATDRRRRVLPQRARRATGGRWPAPTTRT